ncbi:hypothetical protein DSO57_1037092 [Entomophthora muscae]|uniref:Uncharacterized protein n=1 Tax=Entomophthora muscae TaxID=34485 RepID=A0ACC2RDX9_9FUNG|nr:hypothetical protein DSO57_1037092 [Entomophthora muscae]
MNSFFTTIALAAIGFNSIVASEGSLLRRTYDSSPVAAYAPVSSGNYAKSRPDYGSIGGSSSWQTSSGPALSRGSAGGSSDEYGSGASSGSGSAGRFSSGSGNSNAIRGVSSNRSNGGFSTGTGNRVTSGCHPVWDLLEALPTILETKALLVQA